jgi:hypothetical protein
VTKEPQRNPSAAGSWGSYLTPTYAGYLGLDALGNSPLKPAPFFSVGGTHRASNFQRANMCGPVSFKFGMVIFGSHSGDAFVQTFGS